MNAQGVQDRSLQWTVLAMLALGLTGVLAARINLLPPTAGIAAFYLIRQDFPVLLGFAIATIWLTRNVPSPSWKPAPPGRIHICLTAAGTLFVPYALRYILLGDIAFVRDEQMADFDAAIFASHRLFAPVAEMWRPVADATSRLFMLPVAGNGAEISAYLPVHALLRAIVGCFADPDWTSPLMAAISIVALHRIARRLWPTDGASQWVALGALLFSAQYWLTATSGLAMSAHLALNLVWLALFLVNRSWSHAAALITGFAATGLHQPIFHPLFVAPFFLWLLTERRWRLVAVYVVGYAAIGLFWLGWPGWVSANAALATGGSSAVLPVETSPIQRIGPMLAAFDPLGLLQMAINLTRFAAWNHLLLLPLALAGAVTGWRRNGLVRALATGPLLTVLAMAILLPEQGHGWGYRYLHGLLGNFALLAGFGWQAWRSRQADGERRIQTATWMTLVAMLWLGWQAHRLISPFTAIEARITASGADYVLIDDSAVPFARDRVINGPDLAVRPIRLAASVVRPNPAWRTLCAGRTVMLFGPEKFAAAREFFGISVARNESGNLRAAAAVLQRAGCQVEAAH